MNRSRLGHSSTLITKDLLVGVEIGIPSPEGFIPIIPKYVSCRRGAWKRRANSFCRIISEYGPNGIRDSIERSGLKLVYDPVYRSYMPYVNKGDVLIYNDPREMFKELLSHPQGADEKIVRVLGKILGDVDLSSVGLTGSYSLNMWNAFSDIDLVIYGKKNSEDFLIKFMRRANALECKENYGGVFLRGPCVPWRRGKVLGIAVSWIGVPEVISGHCDAAREYHKIKIPSKVGNLETYVSPGQGEALLYPPCVKDENGRAIVSFEYNAGYLLYNGGRLEVSGLYDGRSLFIGTREYPGSIRLLYNGGLFHR
ncbi:MAG: nucleotidyltransferase domain-containing protein [Caldisphaeraceae archaeon]|nr:nucleotidyltransferase domain-containing protein [Caldisphaeraceae archaeon]